VFFVLFSCFFLFFFYICIYQDNQSLLLFQANANGTTAVRNNIELSSKHSVSLVDVTSMTLRGNTQIRLLTNGPRQLVLDSQEHGPLLFQGLVTLLESETSRLGIRGGVRTDKKQLRNASLNKNDASLIDGGDDDDDDTMIQWSRLPGRSHLRQIAAAHQDGTPKYVHGKLLVRDLAKNVRLPLPLSICRVLLLDSNSPVMEEWQNRRLARFEKNSWTFPPATPREQESSYSTEHQLIASGSMCGAHRTWTYEPSNRNRNATKRTNFRLSETHIVDADDSEQLTFQIQERLPRRGFSIKVKVIIRPFSEDSCEASVIAEVRPVGKNMSNPATVHKAFLVALDELKTRYHLNLLAGFSKMADQYPHSVGNNNKSTLRSSSSTSSSSSSKQEEKKEDSIKIQDMFQENASLAKLESHDARRRDDRRPTPSHNKDKYKSSKGSAVPPPPSDTFDSAAAEPVMIEVKPLPKIRLSLMPSPREEDEDLLDENGEPKNKRKSPKKRSSSRRRRSSSRTSSSRGSTPFSSPRHR
jgi:hypothetical protein